MGEAEESGKARGKYSKPKMNGNIPSPFVNHGTFHIKSHLLIVDSSAKSPIFAEL